MSQTRIYGHIPGYPVGSTFKSRDQLLKSGVHAQSQAGISGDSSENGGAFSICISGGYEDNRDDGEKITYVGSGGQDPDTGEQAEHQKFEHPPNKALEISYHTKRPVRVVRGKNDKSYYSPLKGFRYDGLYVVDKAELRRGKKGFKMCFFELRRIREEGDHPIPTRRLLDSKKLSKMLKVSRAK